METFSTAQVAEITQASPRQIEHWLHTGKLPDSEQMLGGSGNRRRWTFHQVRHVVLIRVLSEAGLSDERLRCFKDFDDWSKVAVAAEIGEHYLLMIYPAAIHDWARGRAAEAAAA